MKKKRNQVQKDVATKKKANEPCDDMILEIKNMGDVIDQTEKLQSDLKAEVDKLLNKVGNIVDDSVPVGNDEDTGNRVERKWGTPRNPEGLLNHHDLLWRIGGYEPERGQAVAGHRGYFLKDAGVLLNQAFINYGIAFLRKRNYSILQPPYFMKKEVMSGVAQLEQFDEELYKVGGDGDDKYLIATSEQPICGYHMGEWVDEKTLPLRYSGISTCFRKEAGAHGKDTWGIFRVHQFEKVEQFVICEGDLEKSKLMQDEMIKTAEEFYQSLGFPYHVINIVSGALNNAAIKKLDLECWFPGYNAYRELVSCSNCTDYQSRPMEIRCGIKKAGATEKKYVHMLNATLCATGRAICCLLETYQTKDGVLIPEVLVPFMGGITFLPFVRDSRDSKTSTSVPNPLPAAPTSATTTTSTSTVATPPTAPIVTLSPEEKALTDVIVAKGEEIRKLKDSKGDKDAIKVLVDQLVALKVEFKEKLGKDYGSGGAAAPKEKKDQKEQKQKAPAKEVAAPQFVPAKAPEVPVLAPAYTTPAPIRGTTSNTPSVDECFNGGSVDLIKLDRRLSVFSYVGGYLPSSADAKMMNAVTGNTDAFQNLSRWLRNIKSFSAQEMSEWK